MGNFLAAAKTEKTSERVALSMGAGGASAMQGWRREMEDQHVLREVLPGHALLAVSPLFGRLLGPLAWDGAYGMMG